MAAFDRRVPLIGFACVVAATGTSEVDVDFDADADGSVRAFGFVCEGGGGTIKNSSQAATRFSTLLFRVFHIITPVCRLSYTVSYLLSLTQCTAAKPYT